jgi:hypothetical protein
MKLLRASMLVATLTASCDDEAAPATKPAQKLIPGSLDELAQVCEKGFVYTDVAPITKGTTAPVVVQGKYLDEKAPAYRTHQPPELRGLLAAQFDESKTQLVLCVDAKQTDESLAFQGVNVRGVEYKLRLIEIGTGKTLDTREVTLSPLAMRFGQSKEARAGIPAEITVPTFGYAAFAMLAPFQPDGVTLPDQTATEARFACGGTPLPGAAPFTAGSPAKMRVAYVGLEGHFTTLTPTPIPTPTAEDEALTMKDIALVACVRARPGDATIQTCKYDGITVDVKDGTAEIDIVEARSAKKLASKSFASKPGKCPSVWDADEGAVGFIDVGAEAKAFLDSAASGTPAI